MASVRMAVFGYLMAALWLASVTQAETPLLRVGVVPTLSARVLLTNYAPLRDYLERELHRPVEMRTATGFREFHAQTEAGEFDVVVTAAHLARLVERDQGWMQLATYQTPNRAILLAARDRPVGTVQELRGRMIASADRLALVVIQTVHWLRAQGLREGRDYTLVDAPSFNSAAYAVQQHQAMLAIMSPASMRQLPEALKDDTLVFQTLPEIPGLMWVAHPRMRAEVELLRATLLGFTAELPEGRQFFDATGYRGMRAVSANDMAMLAPYADEIKALLGPAR